MNNEKITIYIDDEDILELIPDYLESRREELPLLRDAVSQGDFETLRGYGHKLKGSGGGYGLDRISEIGARLESFTKASDMKSIVTVIDELDDFINRVEVVAE